MALKMETAMKENASPFNLIFIIKKPASVTNPKYLKIFTNFLRHNLELSHTHLKLNRIAHFHRFFIAKTTRNLQSSLSSHFDSCFSFVY